VFISDTNWNEPARFMDLPAGKYVVITFLDMGYGVDYSHVGGLVLTLCEVVELASGEKKSVTLEVPKPKLNVKVLKGGKPTSGQTLYLRLLDDNQPPVTARSDASGLAVFSDVKSTTHYVCDEDEFKQREAAKDDRDINSMLHPRPLRRRGMVAVLPGRVTEFVLELAPADTCNVVIPPPKAGPRFDSAVLRPVATERSSRLHGFVAWMTVKNEFQFDDVPLGDYDIVVDCDNMSEDMVARVSVTKAGSQTLALDNMSYSVSGTVKSSKGTGNVRVGLIPVWLSSDPEELSYRTFWTDAAKDGKFSFSQVPCGEYWLFAEGYDFVSKRQYAARQKTKVTKETKGLSLTFNDKVGAISLTVSGNAQSVAETRNEEFDVVLLDSGGKPVQLPDPRSAYCLQKPQLIPAIPPGDYTLELRGRGRLPARAQVKVVAGETAKVNLETKAAAMVVVTLKGASLMEGYTRVDATYLGVDGKPVANTVPNAYSVRVRPAAIYLMDVGPEVKSITLRIEGYKEITLNVKTEPGKTQNLEGTPVRKE
jgi:hypothetical protein